MHDVFAVLSLLMSLTFSAIYITQVVKGKVKPHRFSWLLWTMLSATYFVSALQTNGSILFTFGELVGPGIIFLFSLRYGVGGRSRFDVISLIVALIAFILLFVIDKALVGLILALVVDGIGAVLTIRKIAKDRSSESRWPWLLMVVGAIFAILALQTYSVENLLFPIYIVITCGIFFFMANPNAKPNQGNLKNL